MTLLFLSGCGNQPAVVDLAVTGETHGERFCGNFLCFSVPVCRPVEIHRKPRLLFGELIVPPARSRRFKIFHQRQMIALNIKRIFHFVLS